MEFWDLTLRFFSLVDANVRNVVAGAVLLGSIAGTFGCFAFLQKRSLIGDAIAHATLPGVAFAFLILGEKQLHWLLVGATISGWLGALAINAIVKYSRLKLDATLGIVLSVFFGLGIVLLTFIQKSGEGAQSGLDKFLFGQAAAIGRADVLVLSITGLLMFIILWALFGRFKLLTFDSGFAGSLGLKIGVLQFTMTTLLVIAVTIGLQAVGVVLMSAILIVPAAAARQWTDKLNIMLLLSALFGMLSGILGAYISFLEPHFPTGPWIVIVSALIFSVSILFAPGRGMISRFRRHLSNRRKMTQDHILKVLFKSGLDSRNWKTFTPKAQIAQLWSFTPNELGRGLRRLVSTGRLEKEGSMYRLTEEGIKSGARVTRLHRLWEVYLSRYLELPVDHVHRDAEEMEHIITPEVEKKLEEMLGYPVLDPHHREIPYFDKAEK
jgi:manganese/zinc/iron transport system permease protein